MRLLNNLKHVHLDLLQLCFPLFVKKKGLTASAIQVLAVLSNTTPRGTTVLQYHLAGKMGGETNLPFWPVVLFKDVIVHLRGAVRHQHDGLAAHAAAARPVELQHKDEGRVRSEIQRS